MIDVNTNIRGNLYIDIPSEKLNHKLGMNNAWLFQNLKKFIHLLLKLCLMNKVASNRS
jgi:4-aminobutyrate aminotransferase-like enzyme